LVGREHVLADARERLLTGEVRLLTLTGTGGTGKTRLAIAVATSVLEYFVEGVWFIDLSAVTEVDLVVPAIARAVGVDTDDEDVLGRVEEHLRDGRRLLVLDNFEQVLAAAPGLSHLLSKCRGLQVLVTSRAPLNIAWEHVLPVLPLDLPDPARVSDLSYLERSPAVALLIDRARAARGEFELTRDNASAVAEICVRLDGLPLALELAAARTRFLPPAALLERLQSRLDLLRNGRQDGPVRHQSLAAAIDWSYELLPHKEQEFFRRLGVFVGGCDLDAAAALAPEVDALGALESLVSRSLLRVEDVGGQARYRMLETLREYALIRLRESGEEDAARRAHAAYLLGLVERAAPELRGPRQQHWLDRLERDHDNVRAALAWSVEQEPEVALRLGAGLWRYWFTRGYMLEGQHWLDLSLSTAGAMDASPLARARALTGAGEMAWGRGDLRAAAACHRASLALRRQLADEEGMAQALHNLGNIAIEGGDYAEAREMHAESLALRRGLGNASDLALSLYNFGRLLTIEGERERGRELLEESLSLARQVGGSLAIAGPLRELGDLALARGEVDLAAGHYAEALRLAREVGAHVTIARGIESAAVIAHARGGPQAAARLLAGAESLRESIRSPRVPTELAPCEPVLAAAREQLGELAFARASDEGRAMAVTELLDLALTELGEPPPSLPGVPAAAKRRPGGLSEREMEVAVLIAQGLTNRQIADRLVIAERTTHAHVRNILDKLGYGSRVEVATWAVQKLDSLQSAPD
jgi:non-specific serine/threonine protein kinase